MKTGCILVLYNPNFELLDRVIAAIEPQVDVVFVADNSPEPTFDPARYSDRVVYHPMQGNRGIASAQNEGVRYLIDREYDFVFYLDQDSIVEPDMVGSLHRQYDRLVGAGFRPGAVGPRPFNRQSDKKYVGSVKKGVTALEGTTQVTELISSASLIPIEAFKKAGLMDESLFIDGVDHEWCWRAARKGGYQFFICEDTLLSHQLGEGDKFFVLRKVAIPTPFRTYYQVRNYFWLVRRGYVPFYWKASNGFKYFIKLFYYPIFVAPRRSYLKQIWRGIGAGVFMNNK